jgi:hypothetical protein
VLEALHDGGVVGVGFELEVLVLGLLGRGGCRFRMPATSGVVIDEPGEAIAQQVSRRRLVVVGGGHSGGQRTDRRDRHPDRQPPDHVADR